MDAALSGRKICERLKKPTIEVVLGTAQEHAGKSGRRGAAEPR